VRFRLERQHQKGPSERNPSEFSWGCLNSFINAAKAVLNELQVLTVVDLNHESFLSHCRFELFKLTQNQLRWLRCCDSRLDQLPVFFLLQDVIELDSSPNN